MSIESSLKFLWDCASTLKPKAHMHKLLKSYYINLCRRMVTVTQQPLPKVLSSSTQMCPKCGCLWQESDFALKLRPQQVAHKAKTEKLVRKFAQDQRGPPEHRTLTKTQKRRAKWLKKRMTNYLEIKCQQCHNKAQIPMQKPLQSQSSIKMDKGPLKKRSHTCKHEDGVKSDKRKAAKDLKVKCKSPKRNGLQRQQYQVISEHFDTNHNKITKQPERQKQQSRQQQYKHQQQQSKKKLTAKRAVLIQKCSKTQKKSPLVQLAALLKQKSTAVSNSETVTKQLQALLK